MSSAILFGTAGAAATATSAAVPATMGLLGAGGSFALMPALMTTGTLLSAGNAVASADARSTAAKNNASALNYSALEAKDQAEHNADEISMQNDRQADVLGEKQQQQRGEQRAALGASGIAGSGSAAKVIGGSEAQDTMDLATLRENGQAEENDQYLQGLREYQQRTNQAALQSYMGTSALTSGYVGAAGTLLSGWGKLSNAQEELRNVRNI